MDAITQVSCIYLPLTSSLQPRRPLILTPLSFRSVPCSSLPVKIKLKSIKSSSSSSYSVSNFLLPDIKICESDPVEAPSPPPNHILRTAIAAAVTVVVVFSARFSNRPLLAAPIAPPATVESTSTESDEAQSLRDQIELKIKKRNIPEAIQLLEKLIQIQPEEVDWRIQIFEKIAWNGDMQSAKSAFNEIIQRNPLPLEAYHGLFVIAVRSESTKELDDVNDMIEKAMVIARGEKLRGFKLLYAHIRALTGDFNESLMLYDELISENAEDSKPYLFKGIVHMAMNQKEEAGESFRRFARLIPEDHPFLKA